ncbi:DUF7312 domain-containing protein [Halorarius halobius]|uniref:DUF7312 domain-containing protein n=1 Tax=Halorarius halobius TaxID=2962671 RepID=UPI0020CD4701|nr:hypothetical protein [Halorarius halobius]
MTDAADDPARKGADGSDARDGTDRGADRPRTDADGDDRSGSALHVATEGESWTGPDERTLEPGSPSLEGSLFVLLGAAVTLVVLAQFLL